MCQTFLFSMFCFVILSVFILVIAKAEISGVTVERFATYAIMAWMISLVSSITMAAWVLILKWDVIVAMILRHI